MNMKRMMMMAAMAAGMAFGAFADAPTLSVTNVTVRQRYPWNGLVDIDCTVNCSDPTTNASIYVTAKDTASGKPLAVRSVWLESDATHTNALKLKSGKYRLVWDAGKDNPNFVGDAVAVTVEAYQAAGLYLVVDLSGGPDAASYPVSYLDSEPQGGWTDDYKLTNLVLRLIQPGTFMMGSPTDEFGRYDDEPLHEVTISRPFYIGVFEVTQKQYKMVMGSNPSYCYIGEMRPVEQVTWHDIRGSSKIYNWPLTSEVDAASFMGKLRAKTGISTFDLPTEAKWEYACRAGTTTALNSGKNLTSLDDDPNLAELGRHNGTSKIGNAYTSGTLDETGNYAWGTTTVGKFLPNAWGLYDMHGNVAELCLDQAVSMSPSLADYMPPAIDPEGPASRSRYRVERGGGFRTSARGCRSAARNDVDTEYTSSNSIYDYGFRICCSAGLQ